MAQPAQSPQLQLPPDAMQFAAVNYLGNPIAVYKYRYLRMLISAIVIVLIAIFFLALFILNPEISASIPTATWIIFILLGLGLLAFGLWLLIKSFMDRASHVYVFTDGLLRPRGTTTIALRWDQVEAVWQAVTRRYTNGIYTGTTHIYTIRLMDGTKAVFNDYIKNVEALGNTIARETLRVLLPRVISAYNAGSTITFGPLSVSQQGVSNGKEMLPWSQVKDIQVNRGFITVKKEGKWLSWSTEGVARIPNFFVFMALIDYVTKRQK